MKIARYIKKHYDAMKERCDTVS